MVHVLSSTLAMRTMSSWCRSESW